MILGSQFSKSVGSVTTRLLAAASIAVMLNTAASAQGMEPLRLAPLNGGNSTYTPRDPAQTYSSSSARYDVSGVPVKRTRIDNPKVHERNGVRAPQVVTYTGQDVPGNIILDHVNQYVYFILPGGKAIEYIAAVGRDGKTITSANHYVAHKIVEPDWYTANGVIHGPATALGERAFFLKRVGSNIDDDYAMHGTNKPWLLTAKDGDRRLSAGCIRLINPDILDLYGRTKVGAKITVDFKGEIANQITRTGQTITQTLKQ